MTQKVVGDVAVRVGADVGPLKIGLQDAGRSVDRFGKRAGNSGAAVAARLKSVALAAAAMGAAVVAASRKAISSLDGIGKKAAQIGATAEELQKFQFAAKSAGVEATSLNSSLERFVKRVGEAEQGIGAANKELARLGLEAADLADMPLTEQVALVADRLKDMENASEQAASAAALFGREGVAMINMLRDGGDALKATMEEAEAFGAVVSNETVAAAEELEDRLGRLGDGIRGELSEALVEAGPLLVEAAELALKLAKVFSTLVVSIGDTFDAFESLMSPAKRLEDAHDEITAAMADEIRQSQRLDAVLERGGKMSEAMARTKLQEAKARYENVSAMVAEARQAAVGSDHFVELTRQMQGHQDALSSMVPAGADEGQIPFDMREQYEQTEALLARVIEKRQALLGVDKEQANVLEQTKGHIEQLTGALANVSNGVVSLDGPMVNPIDPREDRKTGGGGGSRVMPTPLEGLADGGIVPLPPERPGQEGQQGPGGERPPSFIDQLLGLDEESMALTQERMALALERQQEFHQSALDKLREALEQEKITQEEYNAAKERAEEQHAQAMMQIRASMASQALGSAKSMFDGLLQVAGTGNKRILAMSKAIGAAQAIVNTYIAASDALKSNTFPANIAAAAAVIAQGMAFVASIKSASPGGGGGRGVPSTASQPQNAGSIEQREPQPPQLTRTLNLVGDVFSRTQVERIAEFLNDGSDNGLRIRGR